MDKSFDPQAIEQGLYQKWEQDNSFAPSGQGDPYCVMIPPPNVTGVLHMGHGFQDSIQDALVRYHRMRGNNTLWQVGTDHAGIAVQMIVERQLEATGTSKKEIGREAFLEKAWQWKQQSGSNITKQLRRLGVSVDWQRERFTMDPGLSKAVNEVFVRLYREDLIYRGQRLVNWDPKLKTAISDLEVVSEEIDGNMWHIDYPLADGSGKLTIATTRPETLLGDAAVAVHPKDPRYQHLIGKNICLPLCAREIPIIADPYVDAEFGTGCVKITPAHDFNDYEVGKRHDLPLINILNDDASINDNAPEKYRGLDRFKARKEIVADLEAAGLLVKIEPHTLKIPYGDRSGVVIEPYLTNQWYVKAEPLAGPALAAVKQGDIKFIPENWTKTYYNWLENIEDWCISRQLWWGHQIPAWYDNAGNNYVGYDEADVRAHYGLADDLTLTQDPDVLDTWFSSALWPFSTLGWPEQTPDFSTFYPTNVLVTGFDIIFFWVARMIMMGIHFTKQIPFKEVYITPLIRDHEGKKMSKSKGNALDPIDIIDGISLEDLVKKNTQNLMQPKMAAKIEKAIHKQFPEGIASYGTDALRFTFCALATPGRDVSFDLSRVASYRNFCNKIWNAGRYVLINAEDQDTGYANSNKQYSLADRWIQSRLQHCVGQVTQHFADYRFDLLCKALYEFVWHEFCDWYLELSKPVLTDETVHADLQCGTRHTLISVLDSMLLLLHPMMPFITETIWQQIKPLIDNTTATIMLASYPVTDNMLIDKDAEAEVRWLQQVINGVRQIRGEMQIAPSRAVPLLFKNGSSQDKIYLAANKTFLKQLAKIETITWLNADDDAPQAATALVGDCQILIPLKGLIDVSAESSRLEKELAKLAKECEKIETKLNNPNFVKRAPADVVAQDQLRVAELQSSQQTLQAKLAELASMETDQ